MPASGPTWRARLASTLASTAASQREGVIVLPVVRGAPPGGGMRCVVAKLSNPGSEATACADTAGGGVWPSAAITASRNSPARLKRWRASLDSAFSVMASKIVWLVPPSTIEGGCGASWTTRYISDSDGPTKGGRPAISWKSTTPAPYRSTRWSIGWPRNCSGAMYIGVPRTPPAIVRPELSVRAMPKSAILMRPLRVMITFEGFTSRCQTPCSWA